MEQFKLEEVKFNRSEVLEYLEEVIYKGEAEDFEEEFFEDIKWKRPPSKEQYYQIIHKMTDLYNNGY